jgi:hypothetical protein
MRTLRRIHLVLAILATFAPVAHVLEMPNKLALDGPLWLAVQQHLYRGWGPAIGAPTEIGALLTAGLIAWRTGARWALLAVGCYLGMLACFFVFNGPANAALNGWTAATLPADWSALRMRWELGHALAALLALVALAAALRAERPRGA